MQIRSLLLEQQKKMFVGRKEELRMLEEMYDNPDFKWQLINIFGPSGIGKSTLLRLFAEKIGPKRCIYLDGHYGFTKSEDFLKHIYYHLLDSTEMDQLKARSFSISICIEMINHYAIEHNGFFILFDTFEQVGLIENWLRTEFLPELHPYVKVCFAGRFPLDGPWLRDGWNQLVCNVRLKPLTSLEIKTYANSFGITDSETLTALIRFSRGLPLTLSMACEIVAKQSMSAFLNDTHQQQIFSTLVEELLKDIKQPALMQYLEVATVVWRFDQDLFERILGETVPTNQFREFCRLPFITRLGDSWLLHDMIRQWTTVDLQTRKPDTYQLYRQKALAVLIEREKSSTDKTEYAIDKIFLHENRFVRSLGFSMADELAMRECREKDLSQVEDLYFQFISHHRIDGDEERALGYLLRPLWIADPSSIIGLWKDEKLVAFCTCVPLHKATIDVLKSHRIVSQFIEKIDTSIPHYLMCMAAFDPEIEEEIGGSLARAFSRLLTKKAVFVGYLMYDKWSPLLTLLGFERVPWGDCTSSNGIKFVAYLNDLRKVEYFTKIERSVHLMADPTQSMDHSNTPTFDETIQNMKQLLKHYFELPLYTDIVLSLRHILPDNIREQPMESAIYQLQQKIEFALDQLSHRSDIDRMYSEIIRLAYIDRIGSHETIAERINVSVPTYYRHLKKAIQRLVFLLMNPTSNQS